MKVSGQSSDLLKVVCRKDESPNVFILTEVFG